MTKRVKRPCLTLHAVRASVPRARTPSNIWNVSGVRLLMGTYMLSPPWGGQLKFQETVFRTLNE